MSCPSDIRFRLASGRRMEGPRPSTPSGNGALEAVVLDGRRDRAILAMENAALCRQVRELGGEPVAKSSDEWFQMYQRCSNVIQAAHELVVFLGTGKEMLADWT